MKKLFLGVFLMLAALSFGQVDMSIFKSMRMRQIGPAGMSGRVTCIDVVHSDPNTIYVGTASGGIWKSSSGGTTWIPVGDSMETINIGALAIQQSNPSVIWAGTGEGNPRNSQSSGRGLYRSLNAGRTWELMGLEDTRNIHRIIIHPDDPNTIWVGAQGPAWGDNSNRGVYKTTDGGKTWRMVLPGTENTGIGDLVIDPANPNKLIATMWEFRRNPWYFKSGGKSSGLYISFDGGENWEKKGEKEGLPKGELGRIGLSIAPSEPNRIYAKVEADKNDLYRSDDGGFKWYKISSDENAGDRPFYYSDIFVDPKNENRIYSLWSRVSMSEDGGKTWKVIIPYYGVHPDHHAFWVHPEDPDYMIIGNDGGIAISRDRAETWRFVKNLPVAQYYHINIDNELPYNIYGGMQDNGSWRGPAYVWASDGIRNAYYQEVMFGDGFDVSPDPDEPNRYGYAMSQEGHVGRYDLLTGNTKNIRPTTSDTIPLRFNWNAALAQDPFSNSTIYFGSQFVHKSTDKGDSWISISPDLTTNDTTKQHQRQSGGLTIDATGAENYTTITVIEPSRLNKNILWVGTDDGRVQLTKDGGKSWTSLEERIKGMPKGAWVPQIQASRYNEDAAFVVVNDYRRNNWKPYLFYTEDAGKSWRQLANETIPNYCLSVIQDPTEENLIFLGTENGLYVSFDKGINWNHWTHGYPNVSTMDMKIQERENDLVIGTFGRAAYILDDITPLREMAAKGEDVFKANKLHVFDIPDAYRVETKRPPGVRFGADATWNGQNRTTAARIQVYYHKEKEDNKESSKKSKAKLRVFNEKGDTIRTVKVELEDGVNRVYWRMDHKRPRNADTERPKKDDSKEQGGLPVLPGVYTVEVECDSIVSRKKVNVIYDPRMDVSISDLQEQQDRFNRVSEMTEKLTAICDRLRDNKTSVKNIKSILSESEDKEMEDLLKQCTKMNDTIQGMLDKVLGKKNQKGIHNNDDLIINQMNAPLWLIWGNEKGNAQAFENKMLVAESSLNAITDETDHFWENEWKAFKENVDKASLNFFKEGQ